MFQRLTVFLFVLLSATLLFTPTVTYAGSCSGGCGDCGDCGDGLKVKAEFRWRGEIDGRDFDSDTDMATYSSLRTRLGLNFKMGNTSSFLQFQYPHKLGWNSSNLDTDVNHDVHQAYLKMKGGCCDAFSIKIGRTEMAYGDQRLIGSVGWDNVGRVFDGIIFNYYKKGLFWTDLFFTKQVERSDPDSDSGKERDDLFLGMWGAFTPLNINVFFLHNRDAAGRDTTISSDGQDTTVSTWGTTLSRNTLGLHYWKAYDSGFMALLDFAYQMGKKYTDPGNSDSASDIAAWMLVAGAWYKLDMGPGFTIGAGIDMISGDDPDTEEFEAFDNLYYTGHKWRGKMDYFIASNDEGLRDIFFTLKMNCPIRENAFMMLTFHNFAPSQDYTNDQNEKVTAYGNEIDLVRVCKLSDSFILEMGVGYFMPSENWLGDDADNSLWLYMQLQTKFMHMFPFEKK